jgi:hypothetical protein
MDLFTEGELRLTKEELLFFIELSDEEGYIQAELIEKVELAKKAKQAKKIKEYKGNVSKYFKKFRRRKLVYCDNDVDKQEKRHLGGADFFYIGSRATESPQEELDVFQIILESSLIELESDMHAKLLKSKYVNRVIKKCGLLSFYEIIEKHIDDKEFRRLAPRALLSQPALIEEYTKLPESMIENIRSDYKRIKNPIFYLKSNKLMEILFKFEAKESVIFYREHLAKNFVKNYTELLDIKDIRAMDSNITADIKKFVELDLFLSPATSFPKNHPVNLLFAKPFERLYNDVYICENSDYEIMVQRAYIIYSHFAEILRLGILTVRGEEYHWESINQLYSKSDEDYLEFKKSNFIRSLRIDLFSKKQNLNNLIKELIFYWNIASLRLDFVYCKQRYWEKNSGRSMVGYHLLANSDGIQAIDIDENRSQPGPEMTNEDIIITSLWCGDSDPFSNLRHCYCFKDLNLEERQVSVEEIASAIEDIGF